jgi:hypothetical protein
VIIAGAAVNAWEEKCLCHVTAYFEGRVLSLNEKKNNVICNIQYYRGQCDLYPYISWGIGEVGKETNS